jgi:hypothetical protein
MGEVSKVPTLAEMTNCDGEYEPLIPTVCPFVQVPLPTPTTVRVPGVVPYTVTTHAPDETPVAGVAPTDTLLEPREASTKAVVASLVELSPVAGVGAVGVPVKPGESRGALPLKVLQSEAERYPSWEPEAWGSARVTGSRRAVEGVPEAVSGAVTVRAAWDKLRDTA